MNKIIGILMGTLGVTLLAVCIWSLVEIVRIAIAGADSGYTYLTVLMIAFVLCSRFGYGLLR
jgi:hypothetical protein